MKLEDIGWRRALLPYLESGNIACFGVFTGTSLKELLHLGKEKGLKIPKIYGFDTYTGLPEDEIESQECWHKGNFSSLDHFKVKTPDDAVEKVREFLADYLTYTEFLGIINEYKHLTIEDIKKYEISDLSYVDLDCDLQESSYDALDFLCKNSLLKVGTIIGCDDYGGSKQWFTMEDGQSKALLDITIKYNLQLEPLFQLGNSYPHVHTAFKVI